MFNKEINLGPGFLVSVLDLREKSLSSKYIKTEFVECPTLLINFVVNVVSELL